MYRVKVTDGFSQWLAQLRDLRSKMRISKRITSLECGHLGDIKSLDEGLSELRIHTGKGYRVYFTRYGRTRFLMLCGGNKATQARDIQIAREFMKRPEVKQVIERQDDENQGF